MRVLFVANLAAVDTVEVDQVKADLEKATEKNKRYQQELSRMTNAYRALERKFMQLQQQHQRHSVRNIDTTIDPFLIQGMCFSLSLSFSFSWKLKRVYTRVHE